MNNAPLMGAYYYSWYEGDWLSKTVRNNDRPILGEYDNTKYSEAVTKHMEMAKFAKLDFYSVSWNARDYGHILDAANKAGIKITYFYESMRHHKDGVIPMKALPGMLKEIDWIAEDVHENCWLKIDGRPVLMVYATRAYKNGAEQMFAEIRRRIPNVYLVGDELFWENATDERLGMFDAVTAYNMFQPGKFSTETKLEACRTYLEYSRQRMQTHLKQCQRLKKPLWGCAMPGYNDIGVRPQANHPPVDRLDGDFFKISLNDASRCGDQAMMITSFNEVYEDTQVEPCESYGDLYLNIIRDFSVALRAPKK